MANILAVPAALALSLVLHGCGSSNHGGDSGCKSTPEGDALHALNNMQYGIRTDGNQPLLYGQSKPIFKLCAEHVAINPKPETRMTLITSTSAEDTSKQLSATVGVSGGLGAFSAAASMSSQKTSKTQIQSTRVDRKIKSKLYHVALSTSNAYDLLTEDSRKMLHESEPEVIAQTMGHFFASEAEFGGLLMSTSIIEMTEHDDSTSISAEAEAHFGLGGLKVGLSTDSANLRSEAKEHRSLTILGGDQAPWLAVTNASGLAQAQEQWAKSIKGDKMYVVDTKLKPLWHLLQGKDDKKATQLETFIRGQWNASSLEPYGKKNTFAKEKECPAHFDLRQQKNYPHVSRGRFFCTTSAPTCTASEKDCTGQQASADHWDSSCDSTESSCWTGNKVVCFKATDCCPGYKLYPDTNECKLVQGFNATTTEYPSSGAETTAGVEQELVLL